MPVNRNIPEGAEEMRYKAPGPFLSGIQDIRTMPDDLPGGVNTSPVFPTYRSNGASRFDRTPGHEFCCREYIRSSFPPWSLRSPGPGQGFAQNNLLCSERAGENNQTTGGRGVIVYHYFAQESSGGHRTIDGMFESENGIQSSSDYHKVKQMISDELGIDGNLIIKSLSIVSSIPLPEE